MPYPVKPVNWTPWRAFAAYHICQTKDRRVGREDRQIVAVAVDDGAGCVHHLGTQRGAGHFQARTAADGEAWGEAEGHGEIGGVVGGDEQAALAHELLQMFETR